MPDSGKLPTLGISSTGNIAEDVYNAFSIRWASASNGRPIWYLNLSVDKVSFFIGAVGGVCMGYMLDQYEAPNIDNIDYVNDPSRRDSRGFIFWDLIKHTLSYPLHIVQRFFTAGGVYILIGYATERMLKKGRCLACGALTGLYFSYGSTFTTMVKATVTFATFAVLMEGLFHIAFHV